MSNWLRPFLTAILTAVLVWIGMLSASSLPMVTATPHQAVGYDAVLYGGQVAEVAMDRGPPATYDLNMTADYADGLRSPVASAFFDGTRTPATYTYDEMARFVQTTRRSWVAQEGTGVPPRSAAAAQLVSVAAKARPRVFFSAGGKGDATEWAAANGGQTINITTSGKALGLLDRVDYKYTRPLWNVASARFARGTSGEAHVFLGPDGPLRSTIFWKTELPILRQNGVNLVQHGGWTDVG